MNEQSTKWTLEIIRLYDHEGNYNPSVQTLFIVTDHKKECMDHYWFHFKKCIKTNNSKELPSHELVVKNPSGAETSNYRFNYLADQN